MPSFCCQHGRGDNCPCIGCKLSWNEGRHEDKDIDMTKRDQGNSDNDPGTVIGIEDDEELARIIIGEGADIQELLVCNGKQL